jgi:hypothetical protein
MLLRSMIPHVTNKHFFAVQRLLVSVTLPPLSAASISLLYDLHILYLIKIAPLNMRQQMNINSHKN